MRLSIYYLSAKLLLVWKLKVYKIKIIQMKALWKSIKIIYRILKHCRDFIRRFPIKARRHYWCENSALIIKIMNLFTHRTYKSEMESLVFANQNKSKKKKFYSRKRRKYMLDSTHYNVKLKKEKVRKYKHPIREL